MWGGKQLLSVGSTKRTHSQIRCVVSAEYFTHISCLVVMSIGYCPLPNSTTNSPQSCTGRAMMIFDDKEASDDSDESWVSVITDPEIQSDILCNNRRLVFFRPKLHHITIKPHLPVPLKFFCGKSVHALFWILQSRHNSNETSSHSVKIPTTKFSKRVF